MPEHIYITQKRKLLNPCYTGDIYRYSGPIEDFSFKINQHNYKIQRENLKKLQDTLASYNLSFVYIWAGIRIRGGREVFQFIAKTENGEIYWRKYDVGGSSGQNSIYVGKNLKKINTSKWLKMSEEDRDNMLETN